MVGGITVPVEEWCDFIQWLCLFKMWLCTCLCNGALDIGVPRYMYISVQDTVTLSNTIGFLTSQFKIWLYWLQWLAQVITTLLRGRSFIRWLVATMAKSSICIRVWKFPVHPAGLWRSNGLHYAVNKICEQWAWRSSTLCDTHVGWEESGPA